jgi:hypothetical protein
MVPQVRCKAPTLLRPLQTWSLTSLHSGRILDPEKYKDYVFFNSIGQIQPPAPAERSTSFIRSEELGGPDVELNALSKR